MRRRNFIAGLASISIPWPRAAQAQQDQRVRRIGVLMGDFPENKPEARAVAAALREGLQQLGWTEGHNIRIDTRWAAADLVAMQRFAKELVGSQPELIFSTNTPATATLLQQTRTIPIVFVQVTDPVGSAVCRLLWSC
jgi:putative tryptophan/tyrosine transport system substrate-binding protein